MINISDQNECMMKCRKVYEKFRINYYKSVAKQADDGDDKLTMLEAMTLEVIDVLDEPTVNDVARFLEISQPNAAYKVGTLEKKGYLTKVQSTVDRREFHVVLSEKYDDYAMTKNDEIISVFCRLTESYTEEELKSVKRILADLNTAMEPMMHTINKKSED